MTDQDGLETLKVQLRWLHEHIVASEDVEQVQRWHNLLSLAFIIGTNKDLEKRPFRNIHAELQRRVYQVRRYTKDTLKLRAFPKALEVFGGIAPEQQMRNLSDRLEPLLMELIKELSAQDDAQTGPVPAGASASAAG